MNYYLIQVSILRLKKDCGDLTWITKLLRSRAITNAGLFYLGHFSLYIRWCHNISIHWHITKPLPHVLLFGPQNYLTMKQSHYYSDVIFKRQNWDFESFYHLFRHPYRLMTKSRLKHRPPISNSNASFNNVIFCQLQI